MHTTPEIMRNKIPWYPDTRNRMNWASMVNQYWGSPANSIFQYHHYSDNNHKGNINLCKVILLYISWYVIKIICWRSNTYREFMIDKRKSVLLSQCYMNSPFHTHKQSRRIVLYHTRVAVYSYHVVLPAHKYSALVHSYFALFNVAAVAQYTSS